MRTTTSTPTADRVTPVGAAIRERVDLYPTSVYDFAVWQGYQAFHAGGPAEAKEAIFDYEMGYRDGYETAATEAWNARRDADRTDAGEVS